MPEQRYKCLVGLNYPPNNQRAGAGSVVDDIPESAIPWLLGKGRIEPTDEPLNRIDDTGPQVFSPVRDALAESAPWPAIEPADEE